MIDLTKTRNQHGGQYVEIFLTHSQSFLGEKYFYQVKNVKRRKEQSNIVEYSDK